MNAVLTMVSEEKKILKWTKKNANVWKYTGIKPFKSLN
jgi:hypothetical protein